VSNVEMQMMALALSHGRKLRSIELVSCDDSILFWEPYVVVYHLRAIGGMAISV
jgi:hypothetical protein